jgi:hypothetical protein
MGIAGVRLNAVTDSRIRLKNRLVIRQTCQQKNEHNGVQNECSSEDRHYAYKNTGIIRGSQKVSY